MKTNPDGTLTATREEILMLALRCVSAGRFFGIFTGRSFIKNPVEQRAAVDHAMTVEGAGDFNDNVDAIARELVRRAEGGTSRNTTTPEHGGA